MKISDIAKNNVPQAIAFYRERLAAGTWTADLAHSILHLQDDPDELIDAMNAVRGETQDAPPMSSP